MEFLVLSVMLVAAMVVLIVGGNLCKSYGMFVESYDPSIANIDFKSFYAWYSLNPDRYELRENYVRVNMGNSKCELMGFAKYRDWLKYRKFVANLRDRKNQIISDKSMVKILNTVQSDIDAARAKIENDRNMAKIEISRVLGSH